MSYAIRSCAYLGKVAVRRWKKPHADFLAKFDAANLAMIYEVRTGDGQLSRFSKFVNRD